MTEPTDFELLDVAFENVDRTGFFCYMSKNKGEGYRRKMTWVKDQRSEGMRIKILQKGSRGLIEYIPGEFTCFVPWTRFNPPSNSL